MTGKTVVEIKNLTYAPQGQVILDKINLRVKDTDFIAVIGPNGGGKSTLLRLILGLLEPTRGEVLVLGRTAKKAARLIGYVPQNVHINTGFPITALEVVLMGRLGGGPRRNRSFSAKDRKAAMEALDQMGMAGRAHVKIGEMSGGQRQRIFIARALVTSPELMLLDEPTASIDNKGQRDFYRNLSRINSSVPILVVTHDLLMIADYVNTFACVNKTLYLHNKHGINEELLANMYSCTRDEICPVTILKQMAAPYTQIQGQDDD